MTKNQKLTIAPGLHLLLSVVFDVMAILGRRGRGKTVFAKRVVEEVHKMGRRFCVVDPTGAWWGLKSSADGNAPGLPCVIFGGDHADVPLEPTSGDVLAEFVADPTQPSCVLDVVQWTRGEQIRFLTAFLARLYQRNKHQILLVLDEADQVAPQQKDEKAENLLLGAAQRIVKLGRVKGFGVLLVTQRPASLHKNVLTQAGTLVAFGLTGPQDHKAVLDWIRYQADEEKAREVLSSLPGLERGRAWVWSPELDILKLVDVPLPETFDSSSAPAGGVVEEPHAVAAVDLDKLTAAIQATVQRARENDPKALRARIAELEDRVAEAVADEPRDAAREEAIEAQLREAEDAAAGGQALVDALREREAALLEAVGVLAVRMDEAAQKAQDHVQEVSVGVDTFGGRSLDLKALVERHKATAGQETLDLDMAVLGRKSGKSETVRKMVEHFAVVERAASASPSLLPYRPSNGGPGEKLSKAERTILTALAEEGKQLAIANIGIRGNYATNGGGFRNALGSLRSAGRVVGSDPISITPEGYKALGSYTPLPKGRALLDHWKGRLGLAQRNILDLLWNVPGEHTVEAIARGTGYEPGGGGFRNALGQLRTLGLIEGKGELRLSRQIRG
jgi:uncharacterized protein